MLASLLQTCAAWQWLEDRLAWVNGYPTRRVSSRTCTDERSRWDYSGGGRPFGFGQERQVERFKAPSASSFATC